MSGAPRGPEGEGASDGVEEQFPDGWSDWSQNTWIDWMDAGGSLTARAIGRLESTA